MQLPARHHNASWSQGSLGLFLSVAVLVLALLWMQTPLSINLENKTFDYLQRLRYHWHGPVFAWDHLGLIAIEDQSVDPEYSLLSDPWGRGRWQTREHYSAQMYLLATTIKPKVLAFDLLFPQVMDQGRDERTEKLAVLQQMRLSDEKIGERLKAVEREGLRAMQQELFNMQDLIEAGEKAPRAVFAYVFPQDETGLFKERSTAERRQQDFQWLREQALPPGCITGGPAPLEVVQLPSEELMSAGAGLGAINVVPEVGVVRRVPLLYAFRDPESGELRHLPSFALRSLLAYWNISPANLNRGNPAGPWVEAEAGAELRVFDGEKIWRIPVDEQFRLLLNTRSLYLDVQAVPFVEVTLACLEFQDEFQSQGSGPEIIERREKAQIIRGRLEGKIALVAQALTGGGDIGNFPLQANVPNVLAHAFALDNILREDYLRPPSAWVGPLLALIFTALLLLVYRILGIGPGSVTALLLLLLHPSWCGWRWNSEAGSCPCWHRCFSSCCSLPRTPSTIIWWKLGKKTNCATCFPPLFLPGFWISFWKVRRACP
ncbi:MAG: CHASE2 domain-containing protein [Blastochloris sp.]|nr:CHASE2 domain-containing protein [Blastochloris sp.]